MSERPASPALPAQAVEILASLAAAPRPLHAPGPRDPPRRRASLRWAQRLLGAAAGGGPRRLRPTRRAGAPAPLVRDRARGAAGARGRGAGGRCRGARRRARRRPAAGPHARRQRRGDLLPARRARARRRVRAARLAPRGLPSPLPRARAATALARRRRGPHLPARQDGEEIAIEQRFLEVDRATLSVDRLAAELARYAELYRAQEGKSGEPLWRSQLPGLPAGPLRARRRPAARRLSAAARPRACSWRATRCSRARPRCRSRSACWRTCGSEGPFAPIFRDVRDPGRPVDWLGNPAEERRGPSEPGARRQAGEAPRRRRQAGRRSRSGVEAARRRLPGGAGRAGARKRRCDRHRPALRDRLPARALGLGRDPRGRGAGRARPAEPQRGVRGLVPHLGCRVPAGDEARAPSSPPSARRAPTTGSPAASRTRALRSATR